MTSRLFTYRSLAALFLSLGAAASLHAQGHPFSLPPTPGRYSPLDHREQMGQVGQWQLIAKPSLYGYYQPVRIEVPTQGLVSFYTPDSPQPVLSQAPAQASMLVGGVYRFRVTGLPEYPGLEIYPTVEVLDRLHPTGQEQAFPIPVTITPEEIEAVIREQMVTKVIYLERPQLASALEVDRTGLVTYDVPASSNLIDTADQLGRPMAILRIGGRQPDPMNPHDELLRGALPLQIQSVAP
ncbi:MAG: hypothetical protein R3B90_00845 [Planctomycetaceae bacterium]